MTRRRQDLVNFDRGAAVDAVLEHSSAVSVLQEGALRGALNRHMKESGIRGGPTNISIFVEALRRGLVIKPTRSGGMKLSGDSTHWWNNGATSLNDLAARRITPQKEVNSRIFRARGIRAPENAVFAPGESRRAWAWAKPLLPAVVKPYEGSKGQGVNTELSHRSDFLTVFDAVAQEFGAVLVEEQLVGKEHRVFVIDNQVKAVLRQLPANIVGDGNAPIAELIREKNKTALHPHKPIELGDMELRALRRLDLTPESIVDEGSKIFLRKNTNLSTGGDSIDATNELTSEEIQFVEQASRCWPGLRCAGFDVMLPRTRGDDSPAVIEINSAPGISAHMMPRFGAPRNVAESILDAMFPSPS